MSDNSVHKRRWLRKLHLPWLKTKTCQSIPESPGQLDATMAEDQPHVSGGIQSRRRFLKGLAIGGASAAVPLVLTLRQGAHAAADPSSLNCALQTAPGNPAPPGGTRCFDADPGNAWKYQQETWFNAVTPDLNSNGQLDDFCLVYVDNTGAIGGAPWYGALGSNTGPDGLNNFRGLYDSCWTSIFV